MRSFVVVLLAGLAAVAALGLIKQSSLVYTDGVNPAIVAAELGTGDRACQAPIRVPSGESFDHVGFWAGTYGQPGPPMRVEVLDDASGERLAAGRLGAGYRDLATPSVDVGRLQTEDPLRVCFVNGGPGKLAIIGQVGFASPPTSGTRNGEAIPNDLTVSLRSDERSLLAWLPDMAERASVFRAGWVTPGLYLVLGLGIVVLAPLLLARGIARAAADDSGRS
jgi:hypothetical protein